jgi:hypothetical protein
MPLCTVDGCRRLAPHTGDHDPYPTRAWDFLAEKDKKKIIKAGFATPRGGEKGAYQNHVDRSNKVILPFERMASTNLENFCDGYVIRLFPDQYFSEAHTVRPEFLTNGIVVGENAFVLYRTYDQYRDLPPFDSWQVRSLEFEGRAVTRRSAGVVDRGHYVLRIAAHGNRHEIVQGPPQGIFAPEYCDQESNFLSKTLLAWLITHTIDSPYLTVQGEWLESILLAEGILDLEKFEQRGLTRSGLTNCPLCLKQIRYSELNDTISFSEEEALLNAGAQVINATRSTIVNLFHVQPLTYSDVCHNAQNVAWGHAICNTKLGQRRCVSLHELEEIGIKVGTIRDGQFHTFAWASQSFDMLRSPMGAVWIMITSDHLTADV